VILGSHVVSAAMITGTMRANGIQSAYPTFKSRPLLVQLFHF
jgi:hypothetical protein